MYHCHLHFYLVGHPCRAFEMIKEMTPYENFTHEFSENVFPEEAVISKADVIIASLQNTDIKKILPMLTCGKSDKSQLILLADKEQFSLVESSLSEITDIWVLPMSDEEVRFRFLRWQDNCKMSKDFWQTSHYLETTIDSIPNMIWYKRKDGIHEKVNQSFCETVNKSKAQVEGRDHSYIWDIDLSDPANAGYDCSESDLEVMQKKQTCISEETVKSGDELKLLITYKSPLYDLDGSVMGTVGVGIDITQERAYEEELTSKNRILETIFSAIDCGVICHTLDGSRILRINNNALKILGYDSPDELISAGFDMVAPSVMDEDKPKLRKSIRTLKKEGDSVSVEYRVQHKNGDILHVMGSVKIIEENGELLCQRFLLDCTAQKLKEKKTERHQMELIHALSIDYSLVCFFNLDTGMGTPLRVIEESSHLLDSFFTGPISLEASMEFYIQKFVYEEDHEMMRQATSRERIRKELDEKNLYYINYRSIRNGTIKYYEMKVVRSGIWDTSHGIVLGFRNIDEEIRNEMKQKKLLEDALLQARKANKAKSLFLSNMSHDIRTPMNAIIGFTTLSLSHIDDRTRVEEYLKKIMTSGNHLLNLINDVLDMSQIESGKMQLDEAPCCLTDILYELHNMIQADITAKQLTFHIDTAALTDVEIYCDKLRLNQVLLNIISNSIKYTNAGGSIRLIVTEKADTAMDYANYEFHIIDTGLGMDEEFVQHIFEPFEREKNTTVSGIQGTGLGMAITKNIVDLMNGSIEIKSTLGKGTEVIISITFRLNSREKGAQETVFSQTSLPSASAVSGNKLSKLYSGRILLAEDNELNQEIAVAILNDAGFEVDVAANGQIAVDMLKESTPGYYKLILMDVQMPVMNGYEATKAIHSLPDKELASIPILAMTANAFEQDKQKALRCGMSGHIPKPININTLFNTLNEILD